MCLAPRRPARRRPICSSPLTRVPRHLGEGGDASLIRAIAADLELGEFDPLDCEMAEPWTGPRPAALEEQAMPSGAPLATRSSALSFSPLLSFRESRPRTSRPANARDWFWTRSPIASRPSFARSGSKEIAAVLKGLDGRFVAAGPSGAPTRGRIDVLPTGRNFYSLDNRTVPTPAAWRLGEASARALLDRHFQDHGRYPTSVGLSAWGTSNMRTGGDDIAQALALIGAKTGLGEGELARDRLRDRASCASLAGRASM